MPGLDLRRLGDEGFVLLQPAGLLDQAAACVGQLGFGVVHAQLELGGLPRLAVEQGLLVAQRAQLVLGGSQGGGLGGGALGGGLLGLLVLRQVGQLGVQLAQALAQDPGPVGVHLGLVLGFGLQVVVDGQAQDVGQDLLARGRRLDRELVGPALEEEGAVDEGLVLHAQEVDDLALGLADGVAGDDPPVVALAHLQLQQGLAAAGAAALADDAVGFAAEQELVLHLHLGGRRLISSSSVLVRARPQSAQVMASSRALLPWPLSPEMQARWMPEKSSVGASSR